LRAGGEKERGEDEKSVLPVELDEGKDTGGKVFLKGRLKKEGGLTMERKGVQGWGGEGRPVWGFLRGGGWLMGGGGDAGNSVFSPMKKKGKGRGEKVRPYNESQERLSGWVSG